MSAIARLSAESVLAHLPPDLARRRILSTRAAAAFIGVSEKSLRRMKERRAIPDHIFVSDRKLGWRVGDLSDYLDARAAGLSWPEWCVKQANDNRSH